MKLKLETKYNILDNVKYSTIDIFGVLEGKEMKQVTKESIISAIEIQVCDEGSIHVRYVMENEDVVCGECIIERV